MSQSTELAPSDVRAEAPTLARIAGMTGLFMTTIGVVSIVAPWLFGRDVLFGPGVAYLAIAVGFAGLFVHASRDGDFEVRRLYGGLSALLLVVALVAAVTAAFWTPATMTDSERQIKAIVPFVWPIAALMSLLFAVAFARHETENRYLRVVRFALLAIGGSAAVGAVVVGLFKPEFLLGPGLALALLGLGFLAAFLSREDVTDGPGYWVAVAVGGLGAAALLTAVGRSVVPTVLHEGPAALKTAEQTYVWWKVVVRVVIVLAALGVPALPRLPLWLRGVAAVVGFSVAAVFIYASFFKAGNAPAAYLVPHGLLMAAVGALYLVVSLGVVSDSQFVVLVRRELSAYFYSLIAYLVLLGMAGLAAIGYAYFYWLHLRGPLPEPIVQGYVSFTLLAAFQCVFLVPALTMRLFSEEKRTGTLEVLLTAPVDEPVIVLSKFVSGWLFFMISWLPAGLYLVALREATGVPFDYRPLFSYYIALGACGAAFLSVGMFFSSLTANQIVSAVLTFAVMMFLLLMVWARPIIGASTFPDALQWLQQVLLAVFTRLDFYNLWLQSLSGQLLVRDVLIQLSVAAFWLFLTVKVLEARKWG